MKTQTDQISTALSLTSSIVEVVAKAGEIPAGHLYAPLIGVLSLDAFERLIGLLCRAGLLRRDGDLLIYIGPAVTS